MARQLPNTLKKILVNKVTHKFREATEIVSAPMAQPGPKDVLVKNRFVGINASDINYSAGKYAPDVKPPFNCGFEGIGEVVQVGSECKRAKIGQSVMYYYEAAFSEYTVVPERVILPVPGVKAEYIPLLISGLTAAISLDKVGEMKAGETVMVTAAAGGTGQFAVQLAKNAGCHVIGTCSTDEKVEFLKSIGCDRPINYTKENVRDVLNKEYKNQLDVVYESVGGNVFDACLVNLAKHGRLVLIGFITGYQTQTGYTPSKAVATLPARILTKSASVRGFFLPDYASHSAEYLQKLIAEMARGRIQSTVDNGAQSPGGPFRGLDGIYEAIDYLYSKKNVGKVVVEIPHPPTSSL